MPARALPRRGVRILIGLGIPLPPIFIVFIAVSGLHVAPYPPVNRL